MIKEQFKSTIIRTVVEWVDRTRERERESKELVSSSGPSPLNKDNDAERVSIVLE